MHLRKYEDKAYFVNLTNTMMAAIENNSQWFSEKDLETLLGWTEDINLIKVKVIWPKKWDTFKVSWYLFKRI